MKLKTEKLERIRTVLNKSIPDWAEHLHMNGADYLTGLQEETISLSQNAVDELVRILKITPERLLDGTLNYRALALLNSTSSASLPEIYSTGAFSRVRTSSHLIDFLEIHHGWATRNQVLKHLGLNERSLADPDANISVRFLTDLCALLNQRGFSDSDLFHIGAYSVISNYSSALGRTFRETREPKVLLERAFSEIVNRSFDHNFHYRLVELNQTHCAVEARFNPEALEASRAKRIGSALTCTARGGAFSSIFGYLDLPYAQVKEVTCVHRGDPQCRYEFDFEIPQWCYENLSAG